MEMFQKSKVKQAIKSPQNPSEILTFTQGIELLLGIELEILLRELKLQKTLEIRMALYLTFLQIN